ncbi:hypothetical protein FRC01_008737, partial [Tulasnella sp. 417]
MKFISRVLVSWTLFVFLVVQSVDEDNVVIALLPFLPLILSVAVFTYLVRDVILSQPLPGGYSDAGVSNYLGWASPSAVVTAGAPITTPSPPYSGTIDKPEDSSWWDIVSGHGALAFLAGAVSTALILCFLNRDPSVRDRHTIPTSPLKPTIRRPPSFSTAHGNGTARLVPESQATPSTCPPHQPRSLSPARPDSGATTGIQNRTLRKPASVLGPPQPVQSSPLQSAEQQRGVDRLLPPLTSRLILSSAFGEGDGDDVIEEEREELWVDAEEDQQLQPKEVARRILPLPSGMDDSDEDEEGEAAISATTGLGLRRFIPTGAPNPSIKVLNLRPAQAAITPPSCGDGKDEITAAASTLAPTGVSRLQSHVPAERPTPSINPFRPRPLQGGTRFQLREGKGQQGLATQQRHPTSGRPPAPSRPLPPLPTDWQNQKGKPKPAPTPLLAHVEEEEEEEEEEDEDEDRLGQGRHSLSTPEPEHDASASTSSTAIETPISPAVYNPCKKPSAMKKKGNVPKAAAVSFSHFIGMRE